MAPLKHDKRQANHMQVSRRGFLGSGAASVALQSSLSKAIEGEQPCLWSYTDPLSYVAGETLRLHVSSQAETYDISIYRVGAKREKIWSRTQVPGKEHPIPSDASSRGCRWPIGLEIVIPADWRTGYYEIETQPQASNHAYFIIRPSHPGRDSKILIQLTTNTDSAYNNWGGYSLYAYNGRNGVQGRRVSMLRPMTASTIRSWEVPFLRWAESSGYQLDYAANNDLEFIPNYSNTIAWS